MHARSIILALLLILTSATPAFALPPGVYVDPGSPSGKEYAFPLDALRAAAVGHDAPQGVAQPRFGVGIVPPRASSGASKAAGAATPARAIRAGASTRGTTKPRLVPGRTAANPAQAAANGSVSAKHYARGLSRQELASLEQLPAAGPEIALIGLGVPFAGIVLGAGMIALRRRR